MTRVNKLNDESIGGMTRVNRSTGRAPMWRSRKRPLANTDDESNNRLSDHRFERRIMITRDGKVAQTTGDLFLIANRMTAAINIALHQTGAPAHIRVQAVTVSRRGVLHTTAGPEANAKMVLHFKEAILKAARTVDPGVCDMQENGEWLRFKLARVPLEVYAGTGGLDLLARQLVAENPEMPLEIMRIGWLNSERTIKEGYESGRMKTATVVFAVRDRTTAAEIAKGAIRLGGKQTATTTFVEDLRTAQCETCCGWGHVGSHCHYNNGRRCGMCAGQHTTPEHRDRMHGEEGQGNSSVGTSF